MKLFTNCVLDQICKAEGFNKESTSSIVLSFLTSKIIQLMLLSFLCNLGGAYFSQEVVLD